jgi:hypothetical protein
MTVRCGNERESRAAALRPARTGLTARRRRTAAVVSAALVAALAGCATYSTKLGDLRPQLADGAYDAALATVADQTGAKDRLLFYLETGSILHYADRWAASNEAFAAAERTADELYTKSISEGAISLVTSDASISYRARPYEMAMIPYFRALNYVYLGQREAALVEARKASLLLARYVDATLAGIEDETGRSALEAVRADAFMLYFAGMLYDWDGELNDAFIAYRNAATTYQRSAGRLDVAIPASLGRDLERTGRRLGFGVELDHLRTVCPDVFAAAGDLAPEDAVWRPGHGELVVLVEFGYVPQKSQVRIDVPIFAGESYADPNDRAWEITKRRGDLPALAEGREVEYWLAVALPELIVPPSTVDRVVVTGGATRPATGGRADNLAAAAQTTFAAEYGTIMAKTVARGITKYLLTAEASERSDVAGAVANLFAAATEQADTRSWLTLPEGIFLVRQSLPAGRYDLEVELLDDTGGVVTGGRLDDVEILAGDWTFMSRRAF